MPKAYNLALKRIVIGEKVASCGTAAFTKKPVIVSDISTDKLWKDYKDLALKHQLKSCWSIPILTKSNDVVGTFAIYSESINSPSNEEVTQLNYAVSLAYISIEKAKIKAEVKKRDESYKSLVDQASDAIISYSLEGEIFEFNKAAYTNLGYNKKEFKTLKIQDVIVGDVIENSDNHDKLFKGISVIFNRHLRHKDGSLIDVEVSARLQKDGKILGIVRDITERKNAEVKQQKIEESLLEAQNLAKIGSYNLDLKTQIIQASSSFKEIVGFDLNLEFTFDLWKTLTHPEDVSLSKKTLEKCLKTGEPFDLEFRILTKNNKDLKWIHGLGEVVILNGEATSFFGTIQDITERKQAEINLKAAKEFSENLIISMHEGLSVIDINSKQIHVNPALCKMTGYSEKELLGISPPFPFWPPECYDEINDIVEKTLQGIDKSGETTFKRKNGERFPVQITISDIKNNAGESVTFFAVIQDITERKLAEAELKKQMTRNEHILKTTIDGYVLADAKGQIIEVNNSYCKMSGYTLEELLKMNIGQLDLMSKEEIGQRIAQLISPDEGAESFETQHKCKDGKVIDLEVSSFITKEEDGMFVAAFMRDITQRKITAQALEDYRNQLEIENVYLRNEIDLVFNYEEMVYSSAVFSNVLSDVEKVAPTNATVLLLGESGTGKELLARAVHNIGTRNNKPLIKVNCAAIPSELIESELFGHKKGSFTGAIADKVGKFELADGGTLFLDEIGEMPLEMQPKILRFLQEGEIEVVGGTHTQKLDVRIIAATHKNLKEEIKNNKFREDLYFRINVFPIHVPALRERQEDIPLLIEHFVDKFSKNYGKNIKYISDQANRELQEYAWPGNIRELENLVERAVILSDSETLNLPNFNILEESESNLRLITKKDQSLAHAQRAHITKVLDSCNWKISGKNGAAELLEMKTSTLRDKMKKLDIVKPTKK